MPRWIFALLFVVATTLHAQTYQGKTLVTPTLLANTQQIVPGQPFQIGLLLETAPHWHTYWEYSGDAGFPTTIKWTLPEGFAAGPIQWPLPERLKEPGDIEVYAFGEKTLLITTIVPPKEFSGQSVTIKAQAAWLVCEEICIPGKASLEITLPVATSSQPANEALFQEFQKQWPSAEASPYQLTWNRAGDKWELTVTGLGDAKEIDLYPLPSPDQQPGHASGGTVADGKATVSIAAAGELKGVLVVDGPSGRRGWYVSSSDTGAAASKASASSPVSGTTLWQALFYGFLGGLILNLMPCVLPVISLKIFGFIKQAGEHRGRIFRHGLAFVAGIFTWFMGLGLIIVGLKIAGHEVTWAFQFQNPWFNLIIASIVFVFALNLFGVFEVILPGKANNALAEASSGSGYLGSFSQGLFATLLATPCTAPFLGAALGFAFSQSPVVILALFAAVSLGMSAPYFLLSAQPGWMKILPKPGAWMERVKQFMAFPLLATLIWLLSVLGGQKGLGGVIWAASFLLCLGLACWIYGAFAGPFASVKSRVISFLLILVIVVGGGWIFLGHNFVQSQPSGGSAPKEEGGIAWVDFSAKELAALRAQGKPVFVDFTADWCISCKFNERTAINVPAVRAVFEKQNIVAMKADWTNANPEITAALKEFGRVGVPFYVLYPANNGEPIILPELLTQQIVLDALAKAN